MPPGRSSHPRVAERNADQHLLFEFWPAGQANFTSNTLRVFIGGADTPQTSTIPIGKDAIWNPLSRPYFGAQNGSLGGAGTERSLDVDAFRAFQLETWKGSE